MTARQRADEQQIRHIRACDEENETRYHQSDGQRREQSAGAIERSLPQRIQLDSTAPVGLGIIMLESFRDRRYFRLRLVDGHARFQLYETLHPPRSAILQLVSARFEEFLHGSGDPELE